MKMESVHLYSCTVVLVLVFARVQLRKVVRNLVSKEFGIFPSVLFPDNLIFLPWKGRTVQLYIGRDDDNNTLGRKRIVSKGKGRTFLV